MYISSLRSGRATRTILPSITEMSIGILFLVLWLFPVIASWLVAMLGMRFSYVGQNWQMANVDLVGYLLVISLGCGILATIAALNMLGKFQISIHWSGFVKNKFCRMQWLLIIIITIMSAVGVFRSFGGMVFDRAYSGPTSAWLGYGAWSVTYMFSLSFIIGELLSRRWPLSVVIFLMTLMYSPILLCGSRIDYVSLMLAMSVYAYCFSKKRLWLRAIKSMAIIIVAIVISFFVGNIRYQNFKTPEHISEATFGIGLKSTRGTFQGSGLNGHEKNLGRDIGGGFSGNDMFYLSTLGDVGASFFQTVGLIRNGDFETVGYSKSIDNYLQRLLPGPFFSGRPGDMAGLLPEPVAGGVLHSLGEGYLIDGYMGCVFASVVFGWLAAISIYCVMRLEYFVDSNSKCNVD